jgi:molybdenum-dependent DNA-binding transcriptional regulator ModE
MNQLETYHKLRDMQRKVKHLRDLNTMGSTEDPVSRAAGLAYDNAYGMVDKIANQLYREGIAQGEPEDE